jgi:hypothetical protein
MTTPYNDPVKILFRFYSDVLEVDMVETMWATVIDEKKGIYKLDNIPFYVPSAASDDIVFAEFDANEKMLTYRETLEHSGNSTIQVILIDKTNDINQIRVSFEVMGCVSEKMDEGYFSMEIPAAVNYTEIKKSLDALEAKEIITYAEPCLAEGHRQGNF